MKKLIVAYLAIGAILTPFIYSNNANAYRPGTAGTKVGLAMAGGLYWPPYLFSVEPEVDGESFASFNKSLVDIVNFRNDKLFTGTRTAEHGNMVMKAIGNCAALEGAGSLHDAYNMIADDSLNDEGIEKIRSTLMEKMDGYDFSEIIKYGEECGEDLLNHTSENNLNANPPHVIAPMINGNCENPDEVIIAAGLKPKRIDIHGPEDEDADRIGCAYRQTPKAGESVPKGSTLEYRAWFEAG